MSKDKWNLDLCGIATFAEMCSLTYDEASQWAEDGTVPSIQMGCFRMINLARFRADMERGKPPSARGITAMTRFLITLDAESAVRYLGQAVLMEMVWDEEPEPIWRWVRVVGVVLTG